MKLAGIGRLSVAKWTLYVAATFALVAGMSAPAYAATAPGGTCSPVAPAPTGISKPTGSSAGTFHYDTCTGLYENAYYTWSPATKQYMPVKPYTYTCDTTTGTWQETRYVYVASHDDYEPQTIVVASAPAGYGLCEKPAQPPKDPSPASQLVDTQAADPSDLGGSTLSATNNSGASQNDNTNLTLDNQTSEDAASGDVTANENTSVGNVTSGNASDTANIINSVNTASGVSSGQLASFTKTINGDVNGDLIINPNQLQPSNINLNNTSDVKLNAQTSGEINNTVNLTAQSGDVSANRNTSAGNTTSGNAAAMASVVNMLNSYVSAGQSFVGTININGNLDGNILMPPEFINNLIATGAPATTVTINNSNDKTVNDQTVTNIKNQINSAATSGQVNTSENTLSGDAASGDATTKVDVYNLTGHQIVGANALIVFVNVMGKWVGVIMNAPAGTTSAMYGGNITVNNANNLAVNATTNNSINNNINVAAISGNVTASQNTKVGDVKSGDAKTAVNVANISNDSLDLSGWFGVLFINVFGNWYGNFGVVPSVTPPPHQSDTTNNPSWPVQPKMFKFIPTSSTTGSSGNGSSGTAPSDSGLNLMLASYDKDNSNDPSGAVMGTIAKDPASIIKRTPNLNRNNASYIGYYILCAALVAIGGSVFALDSIRTRR